MTPIKLVKKSPQGIKKIPTPESQPRRTSPRKKLAATMNKVKLQLLRSTAESTDPQTTLKYCEVRLARLNKEAIENANVRLDSDWNKVVKISKEYYVKRGGVSSSLQVDRQRARDTKPGSPTPGRWYRGLKDTKKTMMRGWDREKMKKMQPRMPVDEAKRKQLRGGWKKTELTKDFNQVKTKQMTTKRITLMINLKQRT